MYRSNFNFEDNMEELEKPILKTTVEEVREIQKKFNKDVFNAICNDIEDWLYERFENVRQDYFNSVVAFLLDQKNTYVKDKETLQKWLSGIGYDQISFRKKIYEDNKNEIIKAITEDAVYEVLNNMFDSSYFRSWDFKDITINYPQTTIIKNFMRQLIRKDGFNEEIKKMLDEEIQNKLNQIKYYSEELIKIQENIDNLTNN